MITNLRKKGLVAATVCIAAAIVILAACIARGIGVVEQMDDVESEFVNPRPMDNFTINVHFFVSSVEVVVSRFEEDVSWVTAPPFRDMKVTCYNKGQSTVSGVQSHRLPNVGREGHTYLHHILQNYDRLAPITVFLPGSCMDPHKQRQTNALLRRVLLTRNTVLQGKATSDVKRTLFGTQIDAYINRNANNRSANKEVDLLPCPIRPFGAWFEALFPDLPPIKIICWGGIFAVARDHIDQHPKEHYARVNAFLDGHSNPEAGHYVERAWGAIFFPYPSSCIHIGS